MSGFLAQVCAQAFRCVHWVCAAPTQGVRELWAGLRQCRLLEENDYKAPDSSQQAKFFAGKVSLRDVFAPQAAKCSLNPEEITAISDPHWAAGVAEAWREQGCLTRAWLNAEGDPDLLRDSWRSVLFQPGHVMIHKNHADTPWLVLHSSARYVLVWRCSAMLTPQGAARYRWLRLNPEVPNNVECECLVLADTAPWRTARIMRPPQSAALWSRRRLRPPALRRRGAASPR